MGNRKIRCYLSNKILWKYKKIQRWRYRKSELGKYSESDCDGI
jgi:hypothetical protein